MFESPARGLALTVLALVLALPAHAGWEEGLAAFKNGELDTAAQEFGDLAESQPDWYGGHFMLGQVLLKQGKAAQALSALRRAYDLNPNEVAVQLPLAKAYLETDRYSDAANLLSSLDVSSLPEAQRGAVHQMLALAYKKTGQSELAFGSLAAAARINPQDAKVQFQYGTTALNVGDTDIAVSALEQATALSTEPEFKKVYIQALIRAGREQRGDAKALAYRKATTAGKQLVDQQPTYDNYLLLGEAQLGAADYAEAIATFRKAAAQRSEHWLPHYYIGQAHTALESYESAEAALESALELTSEPDDEERIWKQLGFVYEKQKEYGEAMTAYQRADDQAGVERVRENAEIAAYNREVAEEAERIKELEEERKRLEEELKDLPGGPPPLD